LKQTKIDSGNFAAWKGISVVWWGENNTNVVSFRVKCWSDKLCDYVYV